MTKRTSSSKSVKKKSASKGSRKKTTGKKSGLKGFFTGPLAVLARLRRWCFYALGAGIFALLLWVCAYAALPVPTTPYMVDEGRRLDGYDYEWTALDDIAPVFARAVVAAEDANFCNHWGLDITAIRAAIDEGRGRGASTISQQVVKNAYLWHGRSWPRKALEALLTPAIELVWSKQRIIEVYLNIVEFDEGIFGAEAAARHYFGVGPENLTAQQAAQLAAVLPSPKTRDAGKPSAFVRRRAAQIIDGAATIAADGRSACFED